MRPQSNKPALFLLCLFCLLCSFYPASASDSLLIKNTVPDTAWQQLTSDKDFGYKNEKERKQHIEAQQPGVLQAVIGAIIAFFSSVAGKVILWLLVIFVIGFVLYVIIRDQTSIFSGRNKLNDAEGDNTHNEEDIAGTNWETLLQSALAQDERRLAIRYSYMLLLQLLQQHNLINYRNNKTNYDYYNELSKTAYKQTYRQLSRQYEYTWYGNYTLSAATYDEYMLAFNNLKQQISQS